MALVISSLFAISRPNRIKKDPLPIVENMHKTERQKKFGRRPHKNWQRIKSRMKVIERCLGRKQNGLSARQLGLMKNKKLKAEGIVNSGIGFENLKK
jgi:hypothetical protein